MIMKIERGIPIPEPINFTGATNTLRKMKIGDSVVVPTGNARGWRTTARLEGVKVSIRKISDTETRIWRVKKS